MVVARRSCAGLLGRMGTLAMVVALVACADDDGDGGIEGASVTAATTTTATIAATTTTTATTIATTTPATVAATTTVATTTTPAPTSTTEVIVPDDWAAFTSSRFAFSIQYPSEWVVTPGTMDWPGSGFPYPDSESVDRFGETATGTTWVYVSSVDIEVGRLARAEVGQETALACQLSDWHDITIDGATGRQSDQFCFARDYLIEAIFANESRLYTIAIISRSPYSEESRATFGEMLAAFQIEG